MSEDKLKNILAGVFKIEPCNFTDELAMGNMEAWDSLKHMELVAAIESCYALELSFDEIVTMKSVADIRKVLAAHGKI